ncbi:MAG TPA: phosphodiester glycosidase family protein, partial [Gemmatimonadales bacterium]
LAGRRFAIQGWNRAVPDGLALFDASWSSVMDTASAAIEVVLRGSEPGRVVRVDTTAAGTEIPGDGAVLVARQGAPADLRAALLALHPGDTIRTDVRLEPFHPAEAVGGRPILVRDSAVTDAVDTEGQPGFAGGRHPRTAAGIARGGRRLILVTVDGRQKPYSDGMTLRELAGLLLVLGARDAINLDGGGSTTMVLGGPAASDTLRLVNRPSDSAGERPVGNALAVIASARTCRETRP